MTVEIRRVPPDWEHPRVRDAEEARRLSRGYFSDFAVGDYRPQHAEHYDDALETWLAAVRAWERGEDPQRVVADQAFGRRLHYWEWNGLPPDPSTHRTDRRWAAEEATAYQLYDTTTEGLPRSPVCATAEDLAAWLIANDDYFREFPERALPYVHQDRW
jgi:hypothetical protein